MPQPILAPPPYTPPIEALRLIYLDETILVADKPSGLLSVPGRGDHLADCLATRAAQIAPGARIVHRLDMPTSGLMVLARSAEAHRNLSQQFQMRRPEKSYVALISGDPEGDEGEVSAPLICDWPNRPRQIVEPELGKPALTRWKALQRGDTATRVQLMPITGRTHQLRVHMQHIGHPILGDEFYADDGARAAAARLMLHAETLTIDHPETGERMAFESPAPF